MADVECTGADGVGQKIPAGRPRTPPLPEGCQPLSNQVAGHMHGRGKAGLLESSDGTILKPISTRPSGIRELGFFQEVFREDQSDPVITGLRGFLPKFIGTVREEDSYINYMKLDDVTSKFKKPCIMDVKIGRRAHVRDATQQKRRSSTLKHPHLAKMGFQILGMRIYHPSKGDYVMFDRNYGRELSEDQIIHGLVRYFSNRKSFRCDVVPAFINRLEKIENWFDKQCKYHFVSSSLLFVYEGETEISEIRNPPPAPAASLRNGDRDVILDVINDDVRDSRKYAVSNGDGEKQSHNSGEKTGHSSSGGELQGGKCVDTSTPTCSSSGNTPAENSHDALTDIRMIDFPHVVPSTSVDDDYLYGLRRLINYLKTLLIHGADYHQLIDRD
ncbi:inositol polyphosphate multikinase-like [Ptychodera flava]|uniref:inositol polyphosphate multikinase-like n=1 Tax=Ptychodera flava TaxID=63121 RepID=UPI00396A7923